MIFSVQHFLEDHFQRRGLADVDQYAIKVANLFARLGPQASKRTLARELERIRTVFFRRNNDLDRKVFEEKLATTLRLRFKKKITTLRSAISLKVSALSEDAFDHIGARSQVFYRSLKPPWKPEALTRSGIQEKDAAYGLDLRRSLKRCSRCLREAFSVPMDSCCERLPLGLDSSTLGSLFVGPCI